MNLRTVDYSDVRYISYEEERSARCLSAKVIRRSLTLLDNAPIRRAGKWCDGPILRDSYTPEGSMPRSQGSL